MAETQDMDRFENFDWRETPLDEQKRAVRKASVVELNGLMRRYDWSLEPEEILGWVSAQRGIGLSAAISAFFNGDPGRFNYLPKRDVSAEYRGTASLLDAICQRINAGFYLPDLVPVCAADVRKLERWIEHQRQDLRKHRRGRWVIEPDVLDPVFASKRAAVEDELRRETDRQLSETAVVEQKGFSLRTFKRRMAS